MATKLRTVILTAAGKGTRHLPVTRVTAQEVLPIHDHVAIDFAMAEAVEVGAERIIVAINETKIAIRDHSERDLKFSGPFIRRTASGSASDVKLRKCCH